MEVRFREVDPFNCWLWLHFSDVPSEGERNYLDGIFDSWYVLGRLGGFNSENLQSHLAGNELSWMTYESQDASAIMPALMHNLGQMEYEGAWARCWVDLGTCDAIAIDVLINALLQVNGDVIKLEEFIIGGVNDDWPVEDHPDAIFTSPKE
ncbi:DUF3531 family protein [Prochlorococcus marinus]|uniref:DUF3531 domain-containing protein n=1 Tax=Prochlorococcus marinus (strain MIT 9211) TaxID=93059 RepID=A9BA49_PROM4|nr:DUF3531 family protein [Prochlorococcus marinus]ABX08711.1 conserved hypothetical protein [Prochlorococcus marinus str. MIT 9211]